MASKTKLWQVKPSYIWMLSCHLRTDLISIKLKWMTKIPLRHRSRNFKPRRWNKRKNGFPGFALTISPNWIVNSGGQVESRQIVKRRRSRKRKFNILRNQNFKICSYSIKDIEPRSLPIKYKQNNFNRVVWEHISYIYIYIYIYIINFWESIKLRQLKVQYHFLLSNK